MSRAQAGIRERRALSASSGADSSSWCAVIAATALTLLTYAEYGPKRTASGVFLALAGIEPGE